MAGLRVNLIFPDRRYVKYMEEITTTTTMDRNDIDSRGLYSTEIFGPLGSSLRMTTFAYIDLYRDILHPRVYNWLINISSTYKKIIHGIAKARFDYKTKDFILDDEGDTGYTFFISHILDLVIPKSSSDAKENMIESFNKYKDKGQLFNNKLLVLPAGLREVTLDNDRIVEVDINNFYKDVFNSASMFKYIKTEGSSVDYIYLNIQKKLAILQDSIWELLKGKHKHIGGHWAKRATDYTTRNVATGRSYKIKSLDDDVDFINQVQQGLYQYIKSMEPLVKYLVNTLFLNKIFVREDGQAYLYNPDTNRTELTNMKDSDLDRWSTTRGLTVLFTRLQDSEVKNQVIQFDGKYLLPVYDSGEDIFVYLNSEDIPDEQIDNIRGITYGELLFIAISEKNGKIPSVTTRYPITEQGGTFPAYTAVKTTIGGRTVNVKVIEDGNTILDKKISEYPVIGSPYDDGFSVYYGRNSGLGLDFDGDKIKGSGLMSKEAIDEATKFMDNISNYIKPNGDFTMDIFDRVADTTILQLTREYK